MKFHTSLPVESIKETKMFYSALFDSKPAKEESGYLKFLPDLLDLNISFIRSEETQNGLHLGFEVQNTDELDVVYKRLETAGLVKTSDKEREDSVCCFARQDKFWVVDPSGYEWEIYTLLENTEEFTSGSKSSCCVPIEEIGNDNASDSTSQCCDGDSTQCG